MEGTTEDKSINNTTNGLKLKISDYFTFDGHSEEDHYSSDDSVREPESEPELATDLFVNSNTPHDPQPEPATDLLKFQDNIDLQPRSVVSNLEFVFKCLPLTFMIDYENTRLYEHSKKIIAPKSLLYQLSSYDNIELPVFVRVNNHDIFFGIAEYHDFIDHIYIPTETFYNMGLIENIEVSLSIMKDRPVNATSISIKPLHEAFYMVPDKKDYLEKYLKKLYISLTQGEIIRLPFADSFVTLKVEKLAPEPVVSIFDLDEVDITLLPMVEPKVASLERIADKKQTSDTSNNPVSQTTYTPTQTTNSLGNGTSSMRTNINKNNYYKPANSNASANSNSNSNASANSNYNAHSSFKPFTGNGHTLGGNK